MMKENVEMIIKALNKENYENSGKNVKNEIIQRQEKQLLIRILTSKICTYRRTYLCLFNSLDRVHI